jgi:putative acetyltransferase
MTDFRMAASDHDYEAASRLFKEYANWLGIDLCFQHFDEELLNIKSMYGSPLGCIILAIENETYIGCTAVRPIENKVCELKRMYVMPAHQQKGIAQALLQKAIQFARQAGYQKIRLDTLSSMVPAMRLYEKNGFHQIPAYYFNPEPNAVFYELEIV